MHILWFLLCLPCSWPLVTQEKKKTNLKREHHSSLCSTILVLVVLPGEFLSYETGQVVMVFTWWSYWGTKWDSTCESSHLKARLQRSCLISLIMNVANAHWGACRDTQWSATTWAMWLFALELGTLCWAQQVPHHSHMAFYRLLLLLSNKLLERTPQTESVIP